VTIALAPLSALAVSPAPRIVLEALEYAPLEHTALEVEVQPFNAQLVKYALLQASAQGAPAPLA